ncbi:hypothetical protein [Intrasporangium calvum]|uniref:hypothetical protein n=1 Tax=Intrasporangium calvum TaxID=53358 RepID=UPI000DF5C66B|nr:hypothetical protein [Intrasporangium calvum]AXG15099.1 hypothetical protein DN585_18265 [Intrasporangium calvum]
MPRTLHSAMSIALGVVALTACSAAEASDSPADPRAITVTASDTRSDLSATTAPAGPSASSTPAPG